MLPVYLTDLIALSFYITAMKAIPRPTRLELKTLFIDKFGIEHDLLVIQLNGRIQKKGESNPTYTSTKSSLYAGK